MCGEKWGIKQVSKHQDGSPPRVRGEAFPFCDYSISLRITPACAGRSCQTRPTCGFRRDHPRVCGEKLYRIASASAIRGSPPRVRGEAGRPYLICPIGGITPACAGRSHRRCGTAAQLADHPRVRGEKNIPPEATAEWTGSPPRARGEATFMANRSFQGGITPACAGRRGSHSRIQRAYWDHPRVRGEKLRNSLKDKAGAGSPPRARGEVPDVRRTSLGRRITPACAGRSLVHLYHLR